MSHTLWRISNHADLTGTGGLKVHGRWHNKGIPIVYLSEHPALAMLEMLVHFDLSPDEVPDSYQLLEIRVPDDGLVLPLADNVLPNNWESNQTLTRDIGDQWIASMRSPLLKVPSAITPNSFNYLLNPRHQDAIHLSITGVTSHPYDSRLF